MCAELPDPHLVPGTRRRIDNCDYDAVFSRGGCFHFALRLYDRFKRFGYKIRGIQSENDSRVLGHVWCVNSYGSKGIDIRGVYSEDLLVRLANGGNAAPPRDVTVVRLIIAAKPFPPDLDREIRELADWIFDNHERFELGKPTDPQAHQRFLNDIGEKAF